MPKVVDHEARREQFVRVAWRLIADHGIDDVTVRDIAREAGYSDGILAHYFNGKDELLVHALELSHEQLHERRDREREASTGPDRLIRILAEILPLDEHRIREMKVEMTFWCRSLQNRVMIKIQRREARRHRAFIRSLVEEEQANSRISGKHDPEQVVDLLTCLIDGISLHGVLYPNRVPPSRQLAIMRYALDALSEQQ